MNFCFVKFQVDKNWQLNWFVLIQFHLFFRWLCLWYGHCKTSFIINLIFISFYKCFLRIQSHRGHRGWGRGYLNFLFPRYVHFSSQWGRGMQLLPLWCPFCLSKNGTTGKVCHISFHIWLLILTFIALKVQYAFALHFISYRLLTLGLYWHLVGVSSVSYFYALSFVINVSKLVESRSPRTFYRV